MTVNKAKSQELQARIMDLERRVNLLFDMFEIQNSINKTFISWIKDWGAYDENN